MNVANAIVKIMESEKTTYVFGHPGTQTLPLYDALYDSNIFHFLVRHEQTASQAADAYAKISGKVGVCDASLGPGAMNLGIGVAGAWIDSTPMIAFTGDRSAKIIGKGAFQHIEMQEIFRPITKLSSVLSLPNKVYDTIRTAYRVALSGRPGPVHIVMPEDVLHTEVENEQDLTLEKTFRPFIKPRADPNLIKNAADLLLQAERPVILAGGGCHYSPPGAYKELMELAELLWLPVACTLNGRGCFPENHPLSVGRTGVFSARYVNKFVYQADVVLAVGCRFADLSMNHWQIINPETKIIHIDIDPTEIGKNYPIEIGIVGDAKSALSDLITALKHHLTIPRVKDTPWINVLENGKKEWQNEIHDKITSDDIPLKPQRVMKEIRKFFDRKTIFTLDAGEHKMLAAANGLLDIYEPGTWINSGEFGPMGYGLPAAIGSKVARPNDNVVVIAGDGGFSMTLQELATCVKHNLPVISCVLNNDCLGVIKTFQRRNYDSRFISCDLKASNPDFVKVAEAFNCYGERVERPSEIIPALQNVLNATKEGKPAVIEFITDPFEAPIRV
jgi:acetolactate synthase-1/2/3 large subunit